MPYSREQKQVLNTIKLSGNYQQVTLKTFKADPMGGMAGEISSIPLYFVQAEYSTKDVADPTIAEGLLKILVPAININGLVIPNLKNLIKDKTSKIIFKDGVSLGIRSSKITMPDAVTPVVARLFLGG